MCLDELWSCQCENPPTGSRRGWIRGGEHGAWCGAVLWKWAPCSPKWGLPPSLCCSDILEICKSYLQWEAFLWNRNEYQLSGQLGVQPPSSDGLWSLGKPAGLAGRALSLHPRETQAVAWWKGVSVFLLRCRLVSKLTAFSPQRKKLFSHPWFFFNTSLFNLENKSRFMLPKKKVWVFLTAPETCFGCIHPLLPFKHKHIPAPTLGSGRVCLCISQGSSWVPLPVSFFFNLPWK